MRVELINSGLVVDEREIFRGVNFSIGPGEVLAVTSEEGTGKSFLFRLLALITPPETGEILFDGADPWKERKKRALIRSSLGIIPESIPATELSTVESLVKTNYYLMRRISWKRYRKRVKESLSLMKLDLTDDQPLSSLSRSERARFFFALELARAPKLFFLDSLLSELGDFWGERVFLMLRRLAEEERGAVFFERKLPHFLERRVSRSSFTEGKFTVHTLYRKDDVVI
ncbi:MAG: ATP-binding cassette domain-containing protein [Deltaproteobacteria bacterium]|nr:MAG: ATP-binding cassette domain-containing protein [Deltaproteobacteria bacterium]